MTRIMVKRPPRHHKGFMTSNTMREIIEIDEDLCDGCGLCVPSCHEGALAVIDGKLRVVDDARCDGAGACIGHCPKGALKVIHREAAAFDERYAQEPPTPVSPPVAAGPAKPVTLKLSGGCPGSKAMAWAPAATAKSAKLQPSALTQWPVQLHLLSPRVPFLQGRELLLCADCVAFAMGGFHAELLEGRSLAVACPKLDDPSGYEEKLTQMLAHCGIPALRVAIMEVPCCSGLVGLTQRAVEAAGYTGEVEVLTVSRMGEILRRQTLRASSGPTSSVCGCHSHS